MAQFNIGTIVSTSVHEAYPGHYVQFLWMPQFGSTIRKVLGANSNIEGWAHYCEQMMLDEGYAAAPAGASAEEVKKAKLIRLGQLMDALLRDARFVNSIKLHTGEGEPGGKWTLEQAEDFFVKEGYQTRAIAEVETKRGTADATYLYYTLGKLEIMKLREDYKKKMGAGVYDRWVPRCVYAAGVRADQGDKEGDAGGWIAGAVAVCYVEYASDHHAIPMHYPGPAKHRRSPNRAVAQYLACSDCRFCRALRVCPSSVLRAVWNTRSSRRSLFHMVVPLESVWYRGDYGCL